jgi:hypothetical protein
MKSEARLAVIFVVGLSATACDPAPDPGPQSDSGEVGSESQGESSSSSSSSIDGECEPERPESECSVCLADICCPELQACQSDADCKCVLDCLSAGGEFADCSVTSCPVSAEMPLLSEINYCAVVECSGICHPTWAP